MKIFSILFLVAINNLSAQTNSSDIQITSSELFKVRVDRFLYEYSGSFFEDGKIPNFTSSRNLNLKTILVNTETKKEMDLPNEHVADTLHLNPQLILLNLEKKTISIKGTVSGGWTGGKSDVHIYIGQRNDTIQHIKLVPTLEANIIYNGKELTETVIVDTIPAFNLKNFIHVNSENAYEDHPRRAFEIIAAIDKTSILAIGQNDCFAEIFEIGKLLEYYILPEKGKKKKK
ncbi:hypothetical protein [Flavobacterium sp. '19STA2R22 D10 B1']|uniref:hypothetical protein n=1 Tax=Flavobacterium aerium TaxID=3037261 RepID=UPI00278C413E|nr:hypothetical protein [Flavobacterium sp. '19STA2R22 D10 B1']